MSKHGHCLYLFQCVQKIVNVLLLFYSFKLSKFFINFKEFIGMLSAGFITEIPLYFDNDITHHFLIQRFLQCRILFHWTCFLREFNQILERVFLWVWVYQTLLINNHLEAVLNLIIGTIMMIAIFTPLFLTV